jgi:hypothetical protein
VRIKVARPERFELPTFWFVARRSIQLSYGRSHKEIHLGTDSAAVKCITPVELHCRLTSLEIREAGPQVGSNRQEGGELVEQFAMSHARKGPGVAGRSGKKRPLRRPSGGLCGRTSQLSAGGDAARESKYVFEHMYNLYRCGAHLRIMAEDLSYIVKGSGRVSMEGVAAPSERFGQTW